MSRFVGSLSAAAVVWFIGAALNVPVWRDPGPVGDRCDMAFCAFAAAWLLSRTSKQLDSTGRD